LTDTATLLVPCPKCGQYQPVCIEWDADRNAWLSKDLVESVSAHVVEAHDMKVSGY